MRGLLLCGNNRIKTPGIYHDENAGIISLSLDGKNRITIKDKNIGAISDDMTPGNLDSYGDYFSWGALQNRNGQSASGYTMQEDRSLGNQSIATTGFHIGTQNERGTIISILQNILGITINGTHARQYLKMPFAGQMLDSGTTVVYAEGNGGGYYWTATKDGTTTAFLIRETESVLNVTGSSIGFPRGFPIREIKDTPIVPTKKWTVLYQ